VHKGDHRRVLPPGHPGHPGSQGTCAVFAPLFVLCGKSGQPTHSHAGTYGGTDGDVFLNSPRLGLSTVVTGALFGGSIPLREIAAPLRECDPGDRRGAVGGEDEVELNEDGPEGQHAARDDERPPPGPRGLARGGEWRGWTAAGRGGGRTPTQSREATPLVEIVERMSHSHQNTEKNPSCVEGDQGTHFPIFTVQIPS